MSKRIEVPADWSILIEKRDEEKDRRDGERRRSSSGAKPAGEAAGKPERASKADRREKPAAESRSS